MSNQALIQHLEQCVARASQGPLNFGTVLHELGRDGIAMALLLLCLPFMHPFTMGPISVGGGLVMAAIGLQMARGRSELWLPGKLKDAELEAHNWQRLLGVCRWLVKKFQLLTRTRFTQFTDGDRGHRIAGWFAVAGGALLAIPFPGVPFNNMLPALVVASAAVAVLERDGLMYMLSAFWIAFTLIYFGVIVYLLFFFGAEVTAWLEAWLPSWLH
jgi:hypothetical protein